LPLALSKMAAHERRFFCIPAVHEKIWYNSGNGVSQLFSWI